MRNPFLELLTAEDTDVPGTFWATVTGTNPLRVQRDGDPVLAITPTTLTALEVGDRVLCLLERRQVVVLGRMGGKVEQPEVSALTMKNGWTGYGSGYRYPEYEVFPDGRVQLHGMITPGTTTRGTVIATIPVSLAPSRRHVFMVGVGVQGVGRVDVDPTGDLIHSTFGDASDADKVTWMTLETISW